MKDITEKVRTERTARAGARLEIAAGVLRATGGARRTDKGDALEASRIAGILAVKKTWEALPFCHQIPITHCDVSFDVGDEVIEVEVTATTVARTGVEMEALYGATVAAMNLYDMLKPHASADTGQIALREVKLLEKRGGKSDFPVPSGLAATLFGAKGVEAGLEVAERALSKRGLPVARAESLDEALRSVGLVVLVGAVDPGPFDQELPGVWEALRGHLQERRPDGMLFAGRAGWRGDALVVTLPADETTLKACLVAGLTGLIASWRAR